MNDLLSPSLDAARSSGFASEIKFLVSRPVADEISGWARLNLLRDVHGSGPAGDAYNISSLYLDSPDFDVLHRRGSFARAKYRIRQYGAGDLIFLERKLKSRGLTAKKRTAVSLADLERIAAPQPVSDWPGYWYHRRVLARRLRPVCRIIYSRTARVALTAHGPIRLTMDDRIAAMPAGSLSGNAVRESVRLLNGNVILELKFRHALPSLFEQLIREFALAPRNVSKYRIAGATLRLDAPASSCLIS